jgi:thiol:disulfide interchange protein DsbD
MTRAKTLRSAALVGILFAASQHSFGQGNVLTIVPPDKLTAKAGSVNEARIKVELRSGYHCNSNTPSDEYLIPLKLTWAPGAVEAGEVVYPKPQLEKYSFSEKPLSVYTGNFEILTRFKVAATAAAGEAVIGAKLRYQACTERMCLPPKTVDVSLPVNVVK